MRLCLGCCVLGVVVGVAVFFTAIELLDGRTEISF